MGAAGAEPAQSGRLGAELFAHEQPVVATVGGVGPSRTVLLLGRQQREAVLFIDDATQHLKVGDKVEAKFVGMDRKGRSLQLSIKAKDHADENEALQKHSADSSTTAGTTNLGALLKAKLGSKE